MDCVVSLIPCTAAFHLYSVVLLAALSQFTDIQEHVYGNTVLGIPPTKGNPVVTEGNYLTYRPLRNPDVHGRHWSLS